MVATRGKKLRERIIENELDAYDFNLPEHRIARHPPERREQARLMVVRRAAGTIEHASILDLPDLLGTGDRLVLNDTRVLPARLLGKRASTGGRWEGLFLSTGADAAWRLIGQTRGKLHPGDLLHIHPAHQPDAAECLPLRLLELHDDGVWAARPEIAGDAFSLLQKFGTMPLPPYMRRELADASDFERYQTTFGHRPGSVAAPTAGLHFTPELLGACQARGIHPLYVTLHVGIGTFRPISVARLEQHTMHSEWCEVSPDVFTEIAQARRAGSQICAVGTTTVRTLETAGRTGGAFCGETSLFIRPGFEFQLIDCLLTNFHLPRSSLLVLVSTFAGRDLVLAAYQEAIRNEYRFFSYGDAMLFL